MKQAGPGGGYMPSFVVVPPAEEMGQLAIEVDPVVGVVEIPPLSFLYFG